MPISGLTWVLKKFVDLQMESEPGSLLFGTVPSSKPIPPTLHFAKSKVAPAAAKASGTSKSSLVRDIEMDGSSAKPALAAAAEIHKDKDKVRSFVVATRLFLILLVAYP